MLTDDGPTINAHNLAIGEGFANDAHGLCVKVGLCVGGYQNGTIENQIVSVCGRQAVKTLPRPLRGGGKVSPLGGLEGVIDGMRQRQLQQAVGLTFQCPQFLQFLFHESKVGMVVVTPRI